MPSNPSALAIRVDQSYWDEAQLAVLRSNGIDEGVTRPELQGFLHECQRRRLDPFTRQIYLLGRYDKRAKRKVYRSQTGIDGFRVIARRAADEAKESIEYEDTLWCGTDGQWTDVWLADQPPAACKLAVLRDGKRFPATAKYASYVQLDSDNNPAGLWKKMPDNQLAKCCEALALRKAFPEDLGGLYTEEEMAQADNPQRVQAAVEVVSDEPMPYDDDRWADRPAGELPPSTQQPEHRPGSIDGKQLRSLGIAFGKLEVTDREERLAITERIAGRPLTGPEDGRTSKNLSWTEAAKVGQALAGLKDRGEAIALMVPSDV